MIRESLAKLRFMRDHRFTQAHLSELLDGELPPDERDRVHEHVRWCPECRRMLESLRQTLAALTTLRTPPSEDVAPGVIDRLRREG